MVSTQISDKACEHCGGPVPKRRGPRRFCKPECTQAAKGSCTFEGGCDRPQSGSGLCQGHNHQRLYGGGVLKPLRPKVIRRSPGAPATRNDAGEKFCTRCTAWLPESAFGSHARTLDGLSHHCLVCARNLALHHKFGVTLNEYEEMLAEQGGVCAICREVPAEGKRNLAVDHDHRCCPSNKSCGKCVRGLLCGRCNAGIGMLREDAELFRRAAAYIAR